MASHVVVIASTARRAQVKVTPTTHLSDVLQEACGKLGLDASQYGLKNNNKQIDLSRTIRLSGLSSGAKLELVQLSKSAGVVSVALQLPESEAQDVPNGRLTDKFPSTTTLWLVLRKFETGDGTIPKKNLTARGAPSRNEGNSGAGRLYYQTPVIQVMGRELSSFTDLQKSLAQLGFNSGSTLLRLSFKTSETPLEEAMAQIEEYFKSVDGSQEERRPTASSAGVPSQAGISQTLEEALPVPAVVAQTSTATPEPSQEEIPTTSSSSRPLSIFRPPSSSTPLAARTTHNEADYTPTIEHAQIHQRLLSQSTRNKRLPTEAEIAEQERAEQEKLAAVTEVELKIRMPDQSAISAKFSQTDTGADLYRFVRDCLEARWQTQAFMLRNPGVRGKGEIVQDDADQRLIQDLHLKGRVLVVFGWDETKASMEARSTKEVLKEELRAQARDLQVAQPTIFDDDGGDQGVKVNLGKGPDESEDKGKKKGGMPKWLKGFNKK